MSETSGRRRDASGRFLRGCKPGPGRPARATEATYLLAISEQVTPDIWQGIVTRAVQDALQGDAAARAWLTKYLVGDDPPSLMSLAVAEKAGITINDQIAAGAGKLSIQAQMTRFRAGLHDLLTNSNGVTNDPQ